MQNKYKIFLFIFFTAIALLFFLPNFINSKSRFFFNSKINLGLDLQGGSQLLLKVDFDNFLRDKLSNVIEELKKLMRKNKIGYVNFFVKDQTIYFFLRDLKNLETFRNILNSLDPEISMKVDGQNIILNYSESKIQKLKSALIQQSIEIIRIRVDVTGMKEVNIQKEGSEYIVLQVPGEKNPDKLKEVLGKTARLTFHLVDESQDIELGRRIPIGSFRVEGRDSQNRSYYLLIKKKILISGENLIDAQTVFVNNVQPAVSFTFNNLGSKIFAELTKNNIGKRLAIVLDNSLLSAPIINEIILGGNGIISGNFNIESANELALLLRAGALPAPLKILEERIVGPNLGIDSIKSGKKAAIIGFISVSLFMIWCYGVFGFIATIVLAFSIFYILSFLSLFQATLTMPGIAGIILTMGMAVDANVLIYERIREEAHIGTSPLHSINIAFKTAISTILDSNITTLIVSTLLYFFGIGAVKGFAITLSIGIISSMFSSIIITRVLIDFWFFYFPPKKIQL